MIDDINSLNTDFPFFFFKFTLNSNLWPYLLNCEATNLEFVIQIQSTCIEFLPGAFTCIFHLILQATQPVLEVDITPIL